MSGQSIAVISSVEGYDRISDRRFQNQLVAGVRTAVMLRRTFLPGVAR
jgi:hypothetical protein